MEEIWPLSVVADHFYKDRQDVGFRPVFGSGPCDAQIVDRSSSVFEVIPLEFTQANYDEKMYRRMQFRASHEYGPLTGPVIKTGTRSSDGSVKAILQLVNCTEDRAAQFSKITEAARRKAGRPRLPGTRLGVIYEGLHISKQQDFDQLYEFAMKNLVPVLSSFTFLYLIRSQGDHVIQIPLPNQPIRADAVCPLNGTLGRHIKA
jgi:hypothetical protein